MDSPAPTGETKKIAVRSSIVESFRGCGLSGIRIDKDELKKQLTMPQYLRYAMRDSIRLQDPAAGESRYINRADGEDSAAPPCPMVVFINSRSGGRHGPALKERLQQLMSEEQVFDLSDVKPHEFVRYGLSCLEMLAGLGDSCAKETRERIRVMVAGGDGTVGWVLGCLTELRTLVREPVPPVGIIPLGTGNDLSRSFSWGGSFPFAWRSAIKRTLQRASTGTVKRLDSWRVSLAMPEGTSVKLPHCLKPAEEFTLDQGFEIEGELPEKVASYEGVYYNYFSIGMDAQVAYGFHHLRDEKPYLASGPISNKIIGELLKQKMVPEKIVHHIVQELLGTPDSKSCPVEENVEAICQFFNTIGKQLDESPKSRRINDMYFSQLKELSSNLQLVPRLRFMIRDVLDLRASNWVPRREEIKAKTITEIHSEAEKNLGLRPGATASMRNARGGVHGNFSPGGFPISRPGTGGLMPGMPGSRKMPGMPGFDNSNWEMPKSRSMPRGDFSGVQAAGPNSPLLSKPTILNSKLLPQGSSGIVSGRNSALVHGAATFSARPANFGVGPETVSQLSSLDKTVAPVPVSSGKSQAPSGGLNTDDLRRKTISLLQEYFSVRLLDEALQCVEELKSPSFYPEVVKEAICLALDKSPPCVEPVANLMEYLYIKKILTAIDIEAGCLLFGSLLDDIGIDLPKSPSNFGMIIGKLILAGGLDFKVAREILKKVEDDMFQREIFDSAVGAIKSSASGQAVLDLQTSDIKACQSLLK